MVGAHVQGHCQAFNNAQGGLRAAPLIPAEMGCAYPDLFRQGFLCKPLLSAQLGQAGGEVVQGGVPVVGGAIVDKYPEAGQANPFP